MLIIAFVTALGMIWPETASASCGNYLYRNGKPVSSHVIQMDSKGIGHLSEFATYHDPVQAPVRRCTGPNCSGSPLPLAPVPVVPVSTAAGFDPAIILESLIAANSERASNRIPQSERGAYFEPSSVFRPPA